MRTSVPKLPRLLPRAPFAATATLVALTALTMTPSATAAPKGETKIEAEVRAALRKGDLEAAAEKAARARDAEPTSAAAALLQAQVKVKQGEPAAAMRAYQDYLRLAGSSAPTRERAEAVAKIQDLSLEVGTVVVRSKQKGVRVVVDGTFVGTTPLAEPVPVMPGKHTVGAEGGASKTVTVSEEQAVSVEIGEVAEPAKKAAALAPASKAPRAGAEGKVAAKEPPKEAPLDRSPNWKPIDPFAPEKPTPLLANAAGATSAAPGGSGEAAVAPAAEAADRAPAPTTPSKVRLGYVAAGGLALGSLATGVLASSAVGDYQDMKATLGTTRDDLEGAQKKATLLAGASIGLGVAAAGVLTFTLLSGRREGAPAAPPNALREARGQVTPLLSPTVGGAFVGAGGTFR